MRFSVIWIDSLLITIVTFVVTVFGRLFNTYIPFELAFIVLTLAYSIIFLGWKGQTLGKKICGLSVLKNNETSIGFFTAFIREFFGKVVLGITLPIGIAWVISNPLKSSKIFPIIAFVFVILASVVLLIHYLLNKQTWYDCIARTTVIHNSRFKKRTNFVVGVILVFSSGLIAIKLAELISTLRIAREMSSHAIVEPSYENRCS